MAKVTVYFANTPAINLGAVAPGVTARAQETTEYAIDVDRPPHEWSDTDLVHLLNTMAKIAGELKAGRTFSVDTLPGGETGVALVMYLTADKANGPRLFTERLQIQPAVFNEWWKRNVMPDGPHGPPH